MAKAFYERGLYEGECIGQFLGQSEGGKQTPYIGLQFRILNKVENEQTFECKQYERTVYLYLSDDSIHIAIEGLAHLGYDQPTLKALDPATEGFFDLAGKKCDLWCGIENKDGGTRERWSISVPREKKPRKEATPIDSKEMRRIDALFGKAMKSRGGAPKPAPSTAAVSAQSQPAVANAEDDLPF